MLLWHSHPSSVCPYFKVLNSGMHRDYFKFSANCTCLVQKASQLLVRNCLSCFARLCHIWWHQLEIPTRARCCVLSFYFFFCIRSLSHSDSTPCYGISIIVMLFCSRNCCNFSPPKRWPIGSNQHCDLYKPKMGRHIFEARYCLCLKFVILLACETTRILSAFCAYWHY